MARSPRGFGFILGTFLLPMLLLAAAAEGYGLVRWGKNVTHAGVETRRVFTAAETVVYEGAQAALYLGVALLAARILKSLGGTFHGRHTHTQAFKIVAYGLSPLFVVRLFDALPGVGPWLPWFATWGVGVVLCLAVIYHGVPRVMLPDPPQAFGLYVMTAIMIVAITGLARGFTGGYLAGEFPPVERLISAAAARLPF